MPAAPRPLDPLRTARAADALRQAGEQLLTEHGLRPSDEQSAELYARRILAADDLFGAADDLVVQGDGVTWRSLDAMLELATLARLFHGRLLHPDVDRPENCEWCDRSDDMLNSALLDPIAARRAITISELDEAVRAALTR